jgi:hypothetical protein
MAKHWTAVLVWAGAMAMPAWADSVPFKGTHCALPAPPADAGESLAQGAVLKVFPRKGALGKGYHGCQTTWVESRGHWIPLGVAYFEAGEVAGFWAPPPDAITCKYQARAATGKNAKSCPPASGVTVRSMPAGCANKVLGRAGTEGCAPD